MELKNRIRSYKSGGSTTWISEVSPSPPAVVVFLDRNPHELNYEVPDAPIYNMSN